MIDSPIKKYIIFACNGFAFFLKKLFIFNESIAHITIIVTEKYRINLNIINFVPHILLFY
jgi:hypothetical protein